MKAFEELSINKKINYKYFLYSNGFKNLSKGVYNKYLKIDLKLSILN